MTALLPGVINEYFDSILVFSFSICTIKGSFDCSPVLLLEKDLFSDGDIIWLDDNTLG